MVTVTPIGALTNSGMEAAMLSRNGKYCAKLYRDGDLLFKTDWFGTKAEVVQQVRSLLIAHNFAETTATTDYYSVTA